MASTFSPPYLIPNDESIDMQPWMVDDRGDLEPLSEIIDDWVTGTDITLSRGVVVDLEQIRATCRLPDDSQVGLVVSWMSDSTKIRRRIFMKSLVDRRSEITIRLPGSEIGGTVRLTTSIVLTDDVVSPLPGSPHMSGSVLAKDEALIILEGEGSMFPIAVVDFDTRAYGDGRASWHVETSTALDSNFSSTFQVMINEKDKALLKAIEAPKPTREQVALLDELSSAVMQTVLELAYALKATGDLVHGDFDAGTVGSVLRGLIDQTGDRDFGDLFDPSQISRRRSTFQGLARGLSAGRMF